MARPRWFKRALGGVSTSLLTIVIVSFFAGVVLRGSNRPAFLLATQLFTFALGSWLVVLFLRLIFRPRSTAEAKVLVEAAPSHTHSRSNARGLHWRDLVLPRDVLERLQSICKVMRDLENYQRTWGTLPPNGLLLVGPPGVGKSMGAEVMAHEAGVPFFELDASDLKVEGVWGSAEKRLREFFTNVRENTPAIVFIDEIDSIASKRTKASEFILTLGGTNRPEVLDEAVLSRLSVTIRFFLPDLEAREKLWQHYTTPYAKRLEVSPRELAHLSEGYSGRDIASVCREAPLLAHAKKYEVVGINEFKDAMSRLSLNAKRGR
jgi:SpoVK/Ycf46/Vps4 family AAA+-type ATPase